MEQILIGQLRINIGNALEFNYRNLTGKLLLFFKLKVVEGDIATQTQLDSIIGNLCSWVERNGINQPERLRSFLMAHHNGFDLFSFSSLFNKYVIKFNGNAYMLLHEAFSMESQEPE